jgi:hypothetical protein
MSADQIAEPLIRKQAVYYYLVLIIWPVYLFFLPAVLAYGGWWVLLYIFFPGLYLFTWLGYLMHESWHKFIPNVNNRFFYNTFAFMILSDPQLYFMIHSSHHGQVHTYKDMEFHPLGEIRSRGLRLIYNWLEVIIGIAFLVMVGSITVRQDERFAKKYRLWKLLTSIGVWIVFLGGLGYLSHLVFGVILKQVILAFVLTYWLGSFFLHQSQLVEHGNLFIEGTFRQRNLKTRNLKPAGIFESVFLFMTHNDSREHVLHHIITAIHSRPFPGVVPLPENAVLISLKDYFRILGRMLKGQEDHEIAS